MSTFDGFVEEFPYVQIDYFRKNPDRPSPLACFLSHVHSDHLQGLESFRAPFIYCSAATRELLLRIEKYPHRMNFSKGILESRKLHYRHLSKLLRPIPLDTPTEIELTPRLRIRVTLLDANHCAGAVMFLIEGEGKAILYTGDIRAESWWVNSLVRHPVLIPYTLGSKRLDKIYLDTTFALPSSIHREFPSKAEGLAELLKKVEAYPADTIFYFRAWTFGYEDVWVALSAALNTKVHVDRYQMGLYRSLAAQPKFSNRANEAPFLCGFELGNRFAPGCLSDDKDSRIHSCEPGVSCSIIESGKVVYIYPIVNRMSDGSEVPELGAGGGAGDLYQVHELELPDELALEELERLCLEHIHDSEVLSETRKALAKAFRSKSRSLSLDEYGMKDSGDIPLDKLVAILSRRHSGNAAKTPLSKMAEAAPLRRSKPDSQLPNTIHFPYSRHSSYTELCELVSAFQPKDIYPCTVDPFTWCEEVSMRHLFGHLCSGREFTHDTHMRKIIANQDPSLREKARHDADSFCQSTQQSSSFVDSDITAEGITTGANHANHSQRRDLHLVRKRSFEDYLALEGNAHTGTFISDEAPPSFIAETLPASFQGQIMKKQRSVLTASTSTTTTSSSSTRETSSTQDAVTNETRNEPLTIPKKSPADETAKRNQIRQAWHYLKRHAEDETFIVGPLPSSWPTEEDDGFRPLDPIIDDGGASKFHEDADNNQRVEQHQRRSDIHHPPESLATQHTASSDAENDSLDISSSAAFRQTELGSQHTDDNTVSVPESAFSSQRRPSETAVSERSFSSADNSHGDSRATSALTSRGIVDRSLVRSSSARDRRTAAYLAARADSFEAWSSISFVSAGNNHAEEEIEL